MHHAIRRAVSSDGYRMVVHPIPSQSIALNTSTWNQIWKTTDEWTKDETGVEKQNDKSALFLVSTHLYIQVDRERVWTLWFK